MITTADLWMDAEVRYRQERVRTDFQGRGSRRRRARRDTSTRVAPNPISTERPEVLAATPRTAIPEQRAPQHSTERPARETGRSRIPAA